MIINNITIDGEDINSIPLYSRKKVLRICDLCGEQKAVEWATIIRCRKKHNIDKDYCFHCSMKVYNSGENNPAKKEGVRAKISKSSLGKSKSFKDGKNYRILNKKMESGGYISVWVDEEKQHVKEHRLVLSKYLNKHHSLLNSVHHLNGIKTDNKLENLIELTTNEHSSLHSQLEKLAFELVNKGLIVFNRSNNQYYLSPQLQTSLMERSFGFEDIAIKQNKNICNSRLDVNITSEVIRGVNLSIPLILANMSTVVNDSFCIKMSKLGGLGILHRADSEENIISSIRNVAKECRWVAASIGIEKDKFDFVKMMIDNGCNIINIDVAHGYSDIVLNLAKKIKTTFDDVKVIIGNVTNENIIYECYDFVDAIKVGIAQGLACETKNTAGCGEKQFSAVLKFKHISKNFGIPIISDGGIREPADFTKAIAAGANSVMAGSIFAACPESAAPYVYINGIEKKLYAGMASEYVQNQWKGGLKPGTCAEGGIRYLDIGHSLEELLQKYSGALKSGITYSGGNDIHTFQQKVEFVSLK